MQEPSRVCLGNFVNKKLIVVRTGPLWSGRESLNTQIQKWSLFGPGERETVVRAVDLV